MSGDNEKQPGGNKSGRKQERSEGERRAAVGAGSISTADRAVTSPPETEGSPEEVVSYQTSQVPVPPPEYRFGSGGDVVKEERGQEQGSREQRGGKQNGKDEKQKGEEAGRQRQEEQGGKQGPDKGQQQENKEHNGKHDRQRDHAHDKERDDERQRRHRKKKKHHETVGQLNWKTMLVTAVLALACGVGGAWGYSAMFGPSKSDKHDKGSSKSDSDKGGKSGDKSGDKGKSGSEKGTSSEGGKGGASASEIPGFSSARDADTFKKELEHLAHRLDLLGARIDQ
ncbi:MAG: hypothetical protein ACREHD_25715, partial [Pirellulales bacterium]